MEWGADYFLVLNPDVQLENDFLPPLLIALEARPRCGAAVPVTLSEDGSRIQSVGGDFSLWTGRQDGGSSGKTLPRLEEISTVRFSPSDTACSSKGSSSRMSVSSTGYFLYYEDVELGMRGSREYWETMVVCTSRGSGTMTRRAKGFSIPRQPCSDQNQVWVERSYAGSIRLLCFILFSLSLRWPWKFARCFFTFHFKASFMVIKGCWTGLFGRGLHGVSHLALPVVPRKARPDEPGSNSGEVVARWIQAQDAYLITKHKLDQNYRKRLK